MTTSDGDRPRRVPVLSRRLLAVLVGLLATLGLIMSGAAPASAQKAVGPQPQNWILAVGPHQAAVQTIVEVRGPPPLRHVSATGVAAETGIGIGIDESISTTVSVQRQARHVLGLDRRRWATREQLRIAIVTWIERTYHRRRRQAALGKLTPVEYEIIMAEPACQAA